MPCRSYCIWEMVEWQWGAEIDVQNTLDLSWGNVDSFCSLFYFQSSKNDGCSLAIICWVTDPNIFMMRGTHQNSLLYLPCVVLCFFVEPMRTPKRLKIAETRSRLIAVDWESLGYNITRCHTFNVTICYHYMTANNRSKADCLDMDPKGNTQLNYKSRQCCHYLYCCFAV